MRMYPRRAAAAEKRFSGTIALPRGSIRMMTGHRFSAVYPGGRKSA